VGCDPETAFTILGKRCCEPVGQTIGNGIVLELPSSEAADARFPSADPDCAGAVREHGIDIAPTQPLFFREDLDRLFLYAIEALTFASQPEVLRRTVQTAMSRKSQTT